LERRRAALERYLNRTAAHPSLRTDPDFREFLELDAELPKSSQTSAISGKSVIKFINKVGDRVANITLKMEETDEW
jgi:sorting nexin-1/2